MSVKTIVGIGLVVFIIAGLIFLKLRNRNARTGLLVASVFPAEVNVKITVNLNGGENFDG